MARPAWTRLLKPRPIPKAAEAEAPPAAEEAHSETDSKEIAARAVACMRGEAPPKTYEADGYVITADERGITIKQKGGGEDAGDHQPEP